MATLDPQDFRNAMASFPSGVTVVITRDAEGRNTGFTASAFSSLSLNPPLALVCLDRKADCFPAFEACEQFTISILADGQSETAMKFATRGADKFAGTKTTAGAITGLPLIDGATSRIECKIHARLDGGDHVIIVGEVLGAKTDLQREPMLHYNRQFGHFAVS